jgi:hypothetical protein
MRASASSKSCVVGPGLGGIGFGPGVGPGVGLGGGVGAGLGVGVGLGGISFAILFPFGLVFFIERPVLN